jgi:GGDEF domain-containing protein
MALDAPRRRRARPVADAPIDGPLARIDELAKGWALALIEAAPLRRAVVTLTEPLTRDGPRICDAALRALVEESDLRRLEPGGALRRLAGEVGEMTGSTAATDASRAVDALHDVVWAALWAELPAPDPALVADLSLRLAQVCALIRDAALERALGSSGGRELSAVREETNHPAAAAAALLAPTGLGPDSAEDPPAFQEPAGADPLWMSALADAVQSSGAAARPLSLLIVELEDGDRVLASASPEQADAALCEFIGALRHVVRRQDVLVWESDARARVIAAETSRAAAHALAARIAEAVGGTGGPGGAPLAASVGVAVLGEDGDTSSDLIEAAEEARFSASASGLEVSRSAPERDRRSR